MSNLFEQIAQAVYDGDSDLVASLADEVLKNNINIDDAINKGGVVGIERLGVSFDELEVFLPELMLGGEAMQVLIDKLTANLEGENSKSLGTVVIGTAKGDLHDIGMNLVATQLAVNGFKVIKLGVDVSVSKFIDTAQDHNADIIAVSSLLTTSAYYQEELVRRLKLDGIKDRFKVIVGGGPITPAWAIKIGADGFSRTANLAVTLCKDLMKSDSKETLIYE